MRAELAARGGVLVIDKPGGMTSFSVVNRIRRHIGVKKVGHTGTLDPMATGVLVICAGAATRLVPYLMAESKEYEAVAKLGEARDTDDADGEVTATAPLPEPDRAKMLAIMERWTGLVSQRPPDYSALHVDGVRAHELARKGKPVELASRQIFIESLELVELSAESFRFRVEAGKGTYVRSLARDIAVEYGSLAHLSALRRTRNGAYDLSASITLEAALDTPPAELPWQSAWQALSAMPSIELSDAQATAFRHGKRLPLAELAPPESASGVWRAGMGGQLVAIVESSSVEGFDEPVLKVRTGMPT